MSTTIFKLSDLGISSGGSIQVKSVKGNEKSGLSNACGKLQAPSLTLTGNVISWTAIAHATSYNIYVGGVLSANTSSTSYDLSTLNLEEGEYSIAVTAKDDNGLYSSSTASRISYTYYLPYLTFSSLSSFTLYINDKQKSWDGTLEYSTDLSTWNTWDGTTSLSSSQNSGTKYLYLRGSSNTVITGTNAGSWRITSSSSVYCNGNIENLLDYQTVANHQHPSMNNYCFKDLFDGCRKLASCPKLPATTLSIGCYWGMFSGCDLYLTTAPELPATNLQAYCYYSMFSVCFALTTAPKLPAGQMQTSCYDQMFFGCESLTTPAVMYGGSQVDSAEKCCYQMYKGCTSLNIYTTSSGHTKFYKSALYSKTSGDLIYQSTYQMFYNCYIDGVQSTADYLPVSKQYYY